MDIFHNFFYIPLFNLLIVLYQLLSENLGLAILGVALIAKLITFPLTRRQIKSAEKSQQFQEKTKEIRKKYKNNEEQMAKELAKLQAEFLPGQLGGCLNLIIIIVLLIQVRNVIINLVNQGFHAFNQVAYVESMKIPEDSVTMAFPEGFTTGLHEIEMNLTATNGDSTIVTTPFIVASSDEEANQFLEEYNSRKSEIAEQETTSNRQANIAVYFDIFKPQAVIENDTKELTAFLRPPSRENIDYSLLSIYFNQEQIPSDKISNTEGQSLNFEFLGADLSKVATDIGFSNIIAVLPYVIIALAVGITQFFASRIQSGFSSLNKKAEDKTEEKEKSKKSKSSKKADKSADEPDFAEMMQKSTKQMMYIFPLLTIVMSLGYLGGGAIFPAGVSVFWTGQNGFVIIEQLISNREQVTKQFKSRFIKRNNEKQ